MTAASNDVMARLAGAIVPGRSDILFIARDGGLAAAVRAYFASSHCTGGCGHDEDRTFRRWDFEGQRIQFRVGAFDADPVVVPLRELLAWALERIDPATWVELERLRQARSEELHAEYGDPDLSHRMTYRPKDVTSAERELVGAARARRSEVERATHDLVARALVDGESVAGQIGLFDPRDDDPPAAVEFPDVDGQFALFTDEQAAA